MLLVSPTLIPSGVGVSVTQSYDSMLGSRFINCKSCEMMTFREDESFKGGTGPTGLICTVDVGKR